MRSLSLRARLTLWCVAVVVAVVAFFAAVVLITQREIGVRRIDDELAATHAELTRMLREEMGEQAAPATAAEEALHVLASAEHPIAVLRPDGTVLASRFGGPVLTRFWHEAGTAPRTTTIGPRDDAWRVDIRPEPLGGTPFTLVVASPLGSLARDQRDIRASLWVGIPVALLVAAGGGLWLASVSLRPITEMARRAGSLPLGGEADLGAPVRDDEIGQLTTAFNALVARLRTALRTQQQFMADASHELRSPVSVIRTVSDVALSREHRDESDYRESLAITAAQSRRLGTLVDDMLVLARADAGGYPLRPEPFILDDAIDESQQAVGVLAAARGVTVTTAGESDITVHGDRDLLQRLLFNVLQNAVQHSPAGGTVSVHVDLVDEAVRIRIRDAGKGIAAEDVSRIFERFVQLDPSRRSEGAGLGLTIARWIAEAHGGTLTVESSGPTGTTFCVALPAAGAPRGSSPAP